MNYDYFLDKLETILGNSSTTSSQLNNTGKALFGNLYVNAKSYDKFKKSDLKKNQCIILNTDESTGPGEHWIALVKNNKNKLLKYNSFGNTESSIMVDIKALNADFDAEQKTKETNCGQRSLAWLLSYYIMGEKYALTI